jgi:hypothetical protein
MTATKPKAKRSYARRRGRPAAPRPVVLRVAAVLVPDGRVAECDLMLEVPGAAGVTVDVVTVAGADWYGAWPPRAGALVRVIPARVEPVEDGR